MTWISTSELLFMLGIILVAAFGILRAYGSFSGALSYLNTKEGKGVLAGIVLFIGIALVFAVPRAFSEEVRYFTYAEVFVGLDYTKKLSPVCAEGGDDNNLIEVEADSEFAKLMIHLLSGKDQNELRKITKGDVK